MDRLLNLFCDVDDFCQLFVPQWQSQLIETGQKHRQRQSRLSMGEIITIIIHFHQSHYTDFKAFYIIHVQKYLSREFPNLLSYARFVRLMPSTLMPLCAYLKSRYDQCSGISYIDSTKIQVCHNKRIKRNRVFADAATVGKSTMGWFYGFKLHLVVNDRGGLLGVKFTPANQDDRTPVVSMVSTLTGKLFGDKGYISQQLGHQLLEQGLELITSIRKNMKPRLLTLIDKILLRKRSIIETINDQLKNISQLEHSRHRSCNNFMVNVIGALIAYTHQEKKPSINVDRHQYEAFIM